MTSIRNYLVATAVCMLLAVLPMQSNAEEVPIAAGKLWGESSDLEKRSYLIGVSNFLVLEHAYQSRAKEPPTPYQSSVPDFYQHTDNVTLNQAIQAVDDWYRKNPDKQDTPVLTVLWRTLVEPKL